mmetsp:Transcript_17607/g.25430  ORF Transcript_17607/g.25430 Transcript_17607/m.25430 type:complete len:111 (+) Transcript_17607:407-739(+)
MSLIKVGPLGRRNRTRIIRQRLHQQEKRDGCQATDFGCRETSCHSSKKSCKKDKCIDSNCSGLISREKNQMEWINKLTQPGLASSSESRKYYLDQHLLVKKFCHMRFLWR